MKFSMTGQDKGVLLIEVMTWVGLTISTQILSVYITQTQRIYKAI